jgi:hypothetical protein
VAAEARAQVETVLAILDGKAPQTVAAPPAPPPPAAKGGAGARGGKAAGR